MSSIQLYLDKTVGNVKEVFGRLNITTNGPE